MLTNPLTRAHVRARVSHSRAQNTPNDSKSSHRQQSQLLATMPHLPVLGAWEHSHDSKHNLIVVSRRARRHGRAVLRPRLALVIEEIVD